MKDAKIYTGSGWQSLKGPPGPSAVSADAGNTLKLGGDGLHFTTAPPDSDSYVWCKRGDNLQARYNLARTLTPTGQPLSATNRVTLLILPGEYSDSLTVNANFVDVYGFGQQPKLPAVKVGGISVTATDIRVSGIACEAGFSTGGGALESVFTNCTGGDSSFRSPAAGLYTNCIGGVTSFGATTSTGTYVNCEAVSGFGLRDASGTYINCEAEDQAFGFGASGTVGGVARGRFVDCKANRAFGHRGTGSGSGVASGVFIRCEGFETHCFGGRAITGFGGEASGTFIDCKSGDRSFANAGTLSGTFIRCEAGERSFGSDQQGTFNPVGKIESTARLLWCRTDGEYAPADPAAVIRYCLDGDYKEVSTP